MKLIAEARAALKRPYPHGTETVYAAAVLTRKGNMYSSAQYFSDTYSLTLHAEQAALAHAAAHGEQEIMAIAVTSNEKLKKGRFCYSCHMCKQLLYESQRRSRIPMLVIFVNAFDEMQELQLNDMLSYSWPG
ncbi:hypothetical protein M1555_05030 [Patescibacteria group bacterium]|nr:hypothetical protein [Patescibacteria group bacterium]